MPLYLKIMLSFVVDTMCLPVLSFSKSAKDVFNVQGSWHSIHVTHYSPWSDFLYYNLNPPPFHWEDTPDLSHRDVLESPVGYQYQGFHPSSANSVL